MNRDNDRFKLDDADEQMLARWEAARFRQQVLLSVLAAIGGSLAVFFLMHWSTR